MPVPRPSLSSPAFVEALQAVRSTRLKALMATFPPWYARLFDDYMSALTACLALASIAWFAIACLPLLFSTLPQLREALPWFVGFVVLSGILLILFMLFILTAILMEHGWERRHSNHSFLFRCDREAALAKALDPVSLTRDALALHAEQMRRARTAEAAFTAGYRDFDGGEQARVAFVEGLETLSAALADPQRHACAGGRILVRVTDALVPDAEPLEVPIEDCYADLIERRAAALSR